MFFACLNPQTRASAIAVKIIDTALVYHHPAMTRLDADRFDAFAAQFAARKSADLFYCVRMPEPKIASLLAGNNVPTIILSENPLSSVASLSRSHNWDLVTAVRAMSQFQAAIEPAAGGTATQVLHIDQANDNLDALIDAILRMLDIVPDGSLIPILRAALAVGPDQNSIHDICWQGNPAAPSRQAEMDFDPRDSEAIEKALPPVEEIARSGFCWPARFFHAENGSFTADEPQRLVGRPRTLFFGPHFFLPPGRWRAAFQISIAQNFAGNILLADISSNLKVVAVGRMALPKEGSFEFTLDFDIASLDFPIEARLTTIEGSIGGIIELIDVRFTRLQA